MAKLWGKVRNVIASVAPTVATALGGPLGGIAATAIRAALGVDTDQQAMEALASDPDAVLKLRQAEIEFDKFLVQSDIDLERINAGDRESARNMAIQTGKRPQVILSAVFVTGYFMILGAMIFGYFKPEAEVLTLVTAIVGVLTAGMTNVMQFWFGSSSGSKDKTDHMAVMGK